VQGGQCSRGYGGLMDKKNHPVVVSRSSQENGRNVAAVIRELKCFRIGKRLDGDSIREMIEEGRRWDHS